MNSQIDVIENQMNLFGLTCISDLKLNFPTRSYLKLPI